MDKLNVSEVEVLQELLMIQILELGNKIMEYTKSIKAGMWNERTIVELGQFKIKLSEYNKILDKLKTNK